MTKILIFYDILYKMNEKIWIKNAELNIFNMILKKKFEFWAFFSCLIVQKVLFNLKYLKK